MPRDFISPMVVASPTLWTPGIIALDDMSVITNWSESGTGGDTVYELSTAQFLIGSKELHMKTRTTLGASADYIATNNQWVLSQSDFLKAKWAWRNVAVDNAESFDFYMYMFDGTTKFSFVIRGTPVNQKVFYMNSAGSWEEAVGFLSVLNNQMWGRCEMEGNIADGTYGRVIVDGQDLGIEGVACNQTASVYSRQVQVEVRIYANVETMAEAYFDHLMLTDMKGL